MYLENSTFCPVYKQIRYWQEPTSKSVADTIRWHHISFTWSSRFLYRTRSEKSLQWNWAFLRKEAGEHASPRSSLRGLREGLLTFIWLKLAEGKAKLRKSPWLSHATSCSGTQTHISVLKSKPLFGCKTAYITWNYVIGPHKMSISSLANHRT